MTYLLDTNTCIGWLRQNQPRIVARIQAQAPTEIVLCSVVVAELLFGVERSDAAHRPNAALLARSTLNRSRRGHAREGDRGRLALRSQWRLEGDTERIRANKACSG
jgi:predicted nucleic acid-binding protein